MKNKIEIEEKINKVLNYEERYNLLLSKIPAHAKNEVINNISKKTKFLIELSRKSNWEQEAILHSLTELEREKIFNSWEWTARPEQNPPEGYWATWLLLSGRGSGKSRAAKEWLKKQILTKPGAYMYASETDKKCKQNIDEDPESLINIIGRQYLKSKDARLQSWTFINGSVLFGLSGFEPDKARGNNLSGAVLDELAFYLHPKESLDQLEYALRRGEGKKVITTTPSKGSIYILKEIIESPNTIVTGGSSWCNILNLEGTIFNKLLKEEGTLLGNMETYASLIEFDGKIFSTEWFQRNTKINNSDMDRIVVGWDPSTTNNKESNEDGIVVCGKIGEMGYVLGDFSLNGTIEQKTQKVVEAYRTHKADCIVVEYNQGGDYLPFSIATIDKNIPVKMVHASRGKKVRADPIGQMYEQRRIFHTEYFKKLEEQMISFDPDHIKGTDSPDRMDALVWAFTYLFNVEKEEEGKFFNMHSNLLGF
jgi:phage terminase large subunit-like protein